MFLDRCPRCGSAWLHHEQGCEPHLEAIQDGSLVLPGLYNNDEIREMTENALKQITDALQKNQVERACDDAWEKRTQ